VAQEARECLTCGNIGTADICTICSDDRRAQGEICVVEDVADLWAMERGGAFRGRYHVLGGTLSALDAIGPEELRIPQLVARAGEAVELKARSVTIYSVSVRLEPVEGPHCAVGAEHKGKDGASANSARPGLGEVTLIAHVSKGTYIRSLARDIAYALGTVGHVTYLRRTKAGPFRQEQAISLDNLEEAAKRANLEHFLLPLEAGLDDIPALHLDQTSAQAVRQGRVLSDMPQSSGLYLAKLGKVPVALMEITDGTATVVRGFNLPDVAE